MRGEFYVNHNNLTDLVILPFSRSAEDIAAGRRLVRFVRLPPLHSRKKGNRESFPLRIECAIVSESDIQESDCIVSCILEPEESTLSSRVQREQHRESDVARYDKSRGRNYCQKTVNSPRPQLCNLHS